MSGENIREHVMVDLETMGNGNNAPIMSIGAVKFNQTEILDRFYVAADLHSAKRYGFEFDGSTIAWWLAPEREKARQMWIDDEKYDISVALDGFKQWCHKPTAMWGNGSTFDNIILRNAMDRIGIEYPVAFWQDHCYRTMKTYCPAVKIERIGEHHYAVDDAESQARHLQKICEALEIEL